MKFRSALYHGEVMHHRRFPKDHRFVYRLTTWLIDIDELPVLDQSLTGFGVNRSAVFAFHDRDYGFGDGRPARVFIDTLMADHGLPRPETVELLCQVRAYGHAFNPLSVWFCYDAHKALTAVVYEVRNTFKQRHHYLVPVTEPTSSNRKIHHSASKAFYVSPFMPMDCEYGFHFKPPEQALDFIIQQSHQEKTILTARWQGERQALTQINLIKQAIQFPLNTVKVLSAIHYEALRLWLKGLRLVKRPSPPEYPVSRGQDNTRVASTHRLANPQSKVSSS
jgi:DUF1365 family protein